MRIDLHTHSSASDGELAPAALLTMQVEEGTVLTAITDHDTLAGYDIALATGAIPGLRLLSGIEFSTVHNGREVHVVGLGFEADHTGMREAVAAQAARRDDRAHAIAARLDALGVPGSWDGAVAHAAGAVPARPHFARFLIECGRARNFDDAFNRYLGERAPAYCRMEWPGIDTAVAWIRAAGGCAVLAHPLAYDLSRTRLRALLGAFRECGGDAAEVALAGTDPAKMLALAQLVNEAGLLGSAGSDFHATNQFWRRPSRIPPLPAILEPVWSGWT